MVNTFTQYVPSASTAYCQHLWQAYGFRFRVVKPRRTRLGDFRALPHGQTQITINANLNPYAFLITYVHEVAHADVNRSVRRRTQPHGKTWKTAFQRLMQPLLTEAVFPKDILAPLVAYMVRPAATTYANPALMLALRQADGPPVDLISPHRTLLRTCRRVTHFGLLKRRMSAVRCAGPASFVKR